MAVSQTLTVTEVAGSVDASANTSKVRILWQSTQTGDSWNGYTRAAWYYVSINGGAETAYSVTYTLPKNSTTTIVDTTLKVTHTSLGTGTVKVRTYMDTGISAKVVTKTSTLNLTTIPHETTITSLGYNSARFDTQFHLRLIRSSADYYHQLSILLNVGSKFESIKRIYIGKLADMSTPYSVTLTEEELATIYSLLPNTNKGVLRFTIYTFADSSYTVAKEIGDGDYIEATLSIPATDATKPTATMSVGPVSSMPSPFNTLYIRGRSKVGVNFASGAGKYGATIASYSMRVGGVDYGSTFTSDYLAYTGGIDVVGTVTDSRGISNTYTETIEVLPYDTPKILAVDGESEVVAVRCEADGDPSDSGTYLKIRAKRAYSKVMSEGVQKNFCSIEYRYKAEGGSWGGWTTILADDAESDEVTTGALPDVYLSEKSTYVVEVRAIDLMGEAVAAVTAITLPTEMVYMHKAGSIGSLGIGKYAEDSDTIDIAEHITTNVRGPLKHQGEAVADFIVEYGTNGMWTYRKWHSGIAECWGIYPVTNANISIAWGCLYESNERYQASFPSGLFVDVPVFTMSVQDSTAGILSLETVNSTTKDATCYIYPTRATTGTVSLKIAIRAIGKWK